VIPVAVLTPDALQAQGYHVVPNKTGADPLYQCKISSIQSGPEVRQFSTRDNNGVVQHTFSTVYVTVSC
jgi:hypothetical protein